jgi:hypothetical protein
MPIGKISGPMLYNNLERQGVDLAIEANVLYVDVTNRRVGANTSTPNADLQVVGTANIANITISSNSISSITGAVDFGSNANITISGGEIGRVLTSDGYGRVTWELVSTLATGFGNVSITNNTITSTVQNSNLELNANGNGVVTTTTYDFYAANVFTGNINVSGNANLGNISIHGSTFSSNTGVMYFGSNANVNIGGGSDGYILSTNGAGNLVWSNIASFASNIATTLLGNSIQLGSNTSGYLVSNAVVLTTSTTVTDGLAQLNQVLGKLIPPSPPPFPGSSSLTLSTGTSSGRITNFVQTDNSGWGNLSIVSGTSVSATRVSTYTAGTITSVGPGDSGTVTAYLNGTAAGTVAMAAGSQNGTYGNLVIASDQDYHNVISSVTAGFWESFNASLSGSSIPAGWNRANIADSATGTSTNTITWYYDNSSPGTPTFSNTSIALTSNTVSYSSTVPHFTSSATFTIKGNVARLSGDTYPLAVTSGSSTLVNGSSATGFQTPTAVTYTAAGVTVPLTRNLYVSSGSAYFETTSAIATGFGSTTTGPGLSVTNNYLTGTSGALIVSGTPTILYKTGTASSMEETSITFGSTVGTGSGLAARIINPGSTDTPAQSAGASLFNSQTSTLQTYDATIVAATLKHDQTNYSTGYLPVGPNLSSSRTGSQYFTFRFVRTSLSKFNIKFTGTIAGLWVAVPGSAIDSTASATNGWVTMSSAYPGAGVPSSGCALGGVVTLNSAVTAHSKTCTFGTVSTSDTVTNEVYVRIKLTSGQTITALSLETATN